MTDALRLWKLLNIDNEVPIYVLRPFHQIVTSAKDDCKMGLSLAMVKNNIRLFSATNFFCHLLFIQVYSNQESKIIPSEKCNYCKESIEMCQIEFQKVTIIFLIVTRKVCEKKIFKHDVIK